MFRVVADNPGPITYWGTNTWFVEAASDGALAVIDPGPDDPAHLRAILAAGDHRIRHILVSHAHADHVALAPRLAEALGLPIGGHEALFAHAGLEPRLVLADGDRVAGLTVVHTPGHAAEHLCFARDDGLLFTADHIMGWSTSVVPPPPSGDATDYLGSLRLVLERDDRALLPAHGPIITEPARATRALLAQRFRRERQVITLLAATRPIDFDALLARVYPAIKPGLDGATRANLGGYLARLEATGRAVRDGDRWLGLPGAETTSVTGVEAEGSSLDVDDRSAVEHDRRPIQEQRPDDEHRPIRDQHRV